MDYDVVRYPEIAEIKNFIRKRDIRITRSNVVDQLDSFTTMHLTINTHQYTVLVNDEYDDLKINNPILDFILVFREFKLIEDSSDFLNWCKLNNCNGSNNKLLNYYKEQCASIKDIKKYFRGNAIDYFISDMDFQLNSGVVLVLRNKDLM